MSLNLFEPGTVDLGGQRAAILLIWPIKAVSACLSFQPSLYDVFCEWKKL
jgi:hypothetical protein